MARKKTETQEVIEKIFDYTLEDLEVILNILFKIVLFQMLEMD